MAQKSGGILKPIVFIIALLIVVGGFWIYRMIYLGNVELGERKSEFFYIHTGWNYEQVAASLDEKHLIKSRTSFDWVAKMKKYDRHIRPGRYRIMAHMSNSALLNLLRKGDQEPVHFTFNEVHTKKQLASRVGSKIEADSTGLLRMLNDDAYLGKYGMNSNNILSLFIPATYEFVWTTSAEEFMGRMAKEYRKFWTDERRSKAKAVGLSQTQVVILASIVE